MMQIEVKIYDNEEVYRKDKKNCNTELGYS